MSELKVASCFEFEKVLRGKSNKLFYPKSEADKVIAEKDAEIARLKAICKVHIEAIESMEAGLLQNDEEIQRLENLCESYRIDCDNLAIREANAYKEIERDNKQLQHHKYKRCLAMAMWCWGVKELNRYGDQDYMDFAEKWHKRWLAIAEKFKEAK